MRFLLRRKDALSFGQDYRAAAVEAGLALEPVARVGGRYLLPCELKDVSLLVSFNGHHPADAALIGALPVGIPVVVHHQLQSSFMDPPSFQAADASLRRATEVVVPAQFMQSLVAEDFSVMNVRLVRNGVDPELFRPRSEMERILFRQSLDIPAASKLVAFVAQASPAKGIHALKALIPRLAEDVVVILRSFPHYGPELEELRNLNPRQVRCQIEDGNRSSHPTPFADCLLVLSLSEVAPLVVTESLMSGVPVITTDCTPFYEELLRDGLESSSICRIPISAAACGKSSAHLHFAASEAGELADAVLAALQSVSPRNAAERGKLAEWSRASNLSQDRMLQDYGKIYDRLCTG
jgi:glycosyltransferase involved in cell wall biosynthesis